MFERVLNTPWIESVVLLIVLRLKLILISKDKTLQQLSKWKYISRRLIKALQNNQLLNGSCNGMKIIKKGRHKLKRVGVSLLPELSLVMCLLTSFLCRSLFRSLSKSFIMNVLFAPKYTSIVSLLLLKIFTI